jgi:hypothetical protein
MVRVFTLEEARVVLPQVQAVTRPVFELASSMAEELQAAEDREDDARVESLQARLEALMESWAEAVRELGPDVKGPWLVDFDSGDGYWCWAFPEEDLDHWHDYEGGFSSRVPVAFKPGARQG